LAAGGKAWRGISGFEASSLACAGVILCKMLLLLVSRSRVALAGFLCPRGMLRSWFRHGDVKMLNEALS
jgi:hypothetical protein